jgi:hypothetical protein
MERSQRRWRRKENTRPTQYPAWWPRKLTASDRILVAYPTFWPVLSLLSNKSPRRCRHGNRFTKLNHINLQATNMTGGEGKSSCDISEELQGVTKVQRQDSRANFLRRDLFRSTFRRTTNA